MLVFAVARYLPTVVDDIMFDEADTGGNLFIGHMPSQPRLALSITPTGGAAQLTKAPTNLPRFQVRVRGEKDDPVTPFRLAQAVSDALVCLDGVVLDQGGADEVKVIGIDAIQSEPYPLGQDEAGCHEYTQNFEARTHHPTAHRPAIPA